MADRWSNPSGSLGVERFRVWPDKNVDSWDTAEMVANFDKLDAVIGIPASGIAWPPSEGSNGGIYREIALLQADRLPIGAIVPWWRPHVSVPVPSGFVACVGQTLTAGQHDFTTGGTVQLPDTRNITILGADIDKALLSPGVAGDAVGHAPGIGGTGGSNAPKDLAHVHTVADHSHGLNSHTHTHPHTHTMANHTHNMAHNHNGVTSTQGEWDSSHDRGGASGSAHNFSRAGHRHEIDDSRVNTGSPSTNTTGSASTSDTGPPTPSVTATAAPSTDSRLSSVDTRMKFIGFVLLMKVKHTSSL